MRQVQFPDTAVVHQSLLPQRPHLFLELRSAFLGSHTSQYVRLYGKHFLRTLLLAHFTTIHTFKHIIHLWTPLVPPNMFMMKSILPMLGSMKTGRFKWLELMPQSLSKAFLVSLLQWCSGLMRQSLTHLVRTKHGQCTSSLEISPNLSELSLLLVGDATLHIFHR